MYPLIKLKSESAALKLQGKIKANKNKLRTSTENKGNRKLKIR